MDNDPPNRHVEGLGVALLPAVSPGGTQTIMQRPSLVHAISQNSSHPEVAAYLLNFLYTDEDALLTIGNQLGVPFSRTAASIAEREGMIWGLQLEGLGLLNANVGTMCPLFEDPNMRPPRTAAIEGFRTRDLTARQAAEAWVNNQQSALNQMN
jgi:oligogalacturonide transport system substrate-binding protein